MLVDHRTELFPHALRAGIQNFEILHRKIAAGLSRIEPMQRLLQFAIGVREFRFEVSRIPALRPRFRNIGTDRAR